jgi:branched-chain amino acid transport system substrate-binding protein
MLHRFRLGAIVALFALATSGVRAADPYDVNVIISTSGSGAFLGTHETQAFGVIEKVINAGGGIKGWPVHFTFADDQTSPATAVQLTNGVAAKKVPVFFGSSLAATCTAIAAIVEKNGPVQYCLSPVLRPAPGSYVYSASAGSDSIAAVLLRYFREKGWTKVAIITSTDASGSDFERFFNAALQLPENKPLQIVDREHFALADLSVSAQFARIKSAAPQALVTFTTGTGLGTLLRGYREAGLSIPISSSGGNMIYEQMAQYKDFMPNDLLFCATRGITPDKELRPGPIMDAQKIYFAAFKAAGYRPDFAASLVWDPTMIVVDALRKLGPDATADQLHAYINGLHSWAGIDGIYDFRDGSQRGIAQGALQMYRYDRATDTFEVVSRPAGHVK